MRAHVAGGFGTLDVSGFKKLNNLTMEALQTDLLPRAGNPEPQTVYEPTTPCFRLQSLHKFSIAWGTNNDTKY